MSETIILGDAEKIQKHLGDRTGNESRREVIRKASIIDSRTLEVEYNEETKAGHEVTKKKCSASIHEDLLKAFLSLNDHLGRLCYQPLTEHNPAYETDKTQPQLHCPIHCIGFSLSGNDETEAVSLTGYRTLPNGKEISLKSPSQKWDSDIFDYEEDDDLREAIMTCIGEVELYLFPSSDWPSCKHALDPQLSLFPDEAQVEETI